MKISEFAKLAQVSVQTLIYYDRIGLLKPDYLGDNNYRYYSKSQLKRIYLINRLKYYQFSLAQIKKMLEDENYLGEFTKLIEKKEKQLLKLERELAFLKADYLKIERDEILVMENIKIKEGILASCSLASIRQQIEVSDFGIMYQKLEQLVNAKNYTIQGPYLAVYHSTMQADKTFDIEVGVVIKECGNSSLTKTKTIHCEVVGPYVDFAPYYNYLFEYVATNNLEIIGAPIEIYEKGVYSKCEPSEYVTKIHIPIK